MVGCRSVSAAPTGWEGLVGGLLCVGGWYGLLGGRLEGEGSWSQGWGTRPAPGREGEEEEE